MNGPEHYLEAERLARAAISILDRATPNTNEDAQRQASALAAIGQVHATLAEVAGFVEQVGLAVEPLQANDHGPAEPGNEWGRAVFGDPS